MNQHLSLFNWSLRKVLLTESDTFCRAKIRILFTMLLFSLIKLTVALITAAVYEQDFQFWRSSIIMLFDIVLLKALLVNKNFMTPIAHVMLWVGIPIIWTNILVVSQTVNIVTIQLAFMIMLSSFYLLNRAFSIFYSVMAISPIIVTLLNNRAPFSSTTVPAELGSPGFQIIVVFNFITVIISHYLYHQAFSENIAEKEMLNTRLQLAVREANKAAQSKSDFLSTMSHELRTPLNSVIGMTDLLLDDPYNESQAENLKILNFSAVSLHSLVNDILDFNKLDSEKLRLEAISVNLSTLVSSICAGLRIQAHEKGLELELQLDERLDRVHVVTDPTRITQILYNLVGNAVKFTSEGRVSVKVDVISAHPQVLTTRFSVIDSGIGISRQQQEEIFEPFIQASTSTTREFGGTGLGLAIVKRLLTLFGSEIHLNSLPGKGSEFYFEVALPIDSSPATGTVPRVSSGYDLSGLKVLVAEDNTLNRVLLKKLFYKWHNEPEFAENGQEALGKAISNSYDVVLMDIHMPVMDGYEATRQIRQSYPSSRPHLSIIALTASVSTNLRQKITLAGMDDYVCKPFNAKELYEKLKVIQEKNAPVDTSQSA